MACERKREKWLRARKRRDELKKQQAKKPTTARRAYLAAITALTERRRKAVERCENANKLPTGFGVDYAFTPHPSISALKSADVKFVARYLSNVDPRDPSATKTLSVNEAKALKKAGYPIVLVFETTAGRATAGRAAGVADARKARSHATILGAPASTPIYFAVDFDGSVGQVAEYFQGVNSVLGISKTGAYGGFNIIEGLFKAGRISYGWQTLAWSGGRWSPRAALQQYAIERKLGGCDVDFNRAVSSNYGAW